MYDAKILADSISPAGHRLTSWEVTFPRIVLAELNTHCMLSRNSASSRAIPVDKRIRAVTADPFIPEVFGSNQKGMQPGAALAEEETQEARQLWEDAMDHAVLSAGLLAKLGVHKQYANRLLEPFSWHTAVITATDLDNFFHLRISPLAQGELRKAAEMMLDCSNKAPRPLNYDEWHLPYVDPSEAFNLETAGLDVAKISVARCARVSYLTQNGVRDPAEDLVLYDRLVSSGHMSPLEHVARPMTQDELLVTRAFDVSFDQGPMLRTGGWNGPLSSRPEIGATTSAGTLTAMRGPLHYSGKLNGWISCRSHVPHEWDSLGVHS